MSAKHPTTAFVTTCVVSKGNQSMLCFKLSHKILTDVPTFTSLLAAVTTLSSEAAVNFIKLIP
jgi:hypothetical protein